MTSKLRAVSFFAGVGGFCLAMKRNGIDVAYQIEIDSAASSILARHFPESKRLGDVKKVTQADLPGEFDLFVGGFPCTDISIAGRREGLAGESSGLWFEFHRLIIACKPRFVFIENVPGLLSSNAGRDFAVVVAGLTGILPDVPQGGWRNSGFFRGRPGLYSVALRGLDSQYAGVAQRRRRCFIVGSLTDGSCAEILFERESLSWDPPTRQTARQAAPRHALSGVGIGGQGGSNRDSEGLYENHQSMDLLEADAVAGTLAASGAGSARPAGNVNETDLIIPVEVGAFRMEAFGQYADDDSASTLKARDFKDATDLIAYNLTFCDANGRRQDRPNGGLYVNETDKANTIAANGPGEGTVIAFMAGQGAKAGGIGDSERVSPTLKGVNSGTNQVPVVAIDLQQVTSVINRSVPHEVTPPLTPQSETVVWEKNQIAIHSGNGEDISPILTSEGAGASEDDRGRHAFVVTETASTLSSAPPNRRNGGSDPTAGHFVVEAFDVRNETLNGDLSGTLQAKKTGGYSLNYQNPIMIAPAGEESAEVTAFDRSKAQWHDELTGTLRVGGSATQGVNPGKSDQWCAAGKFGVRRLTPVETERLQAFPDNWTRWRADGTEQSDTARYKQMGNAVTVSVVAWIIERIVRAAGENHE